MRTLLYASLVVFPLCAAGVTTAAAQTAPSPLLTMQQAIAVARSRNPTLLAAQQHTAATRASEITAGLRVNPIFTATGQDITLPADNPGNPYFYSGNVSRLFERGQKRRWRLDSARATTAVTGSQTADLERGVVLNVKTAFTNMLLAKAALQLSEQNLADYRKTVDLSRVRLDAGDISPTDFERIDLQLAQFETDRDTARLTLDQASASLQLLLGTERAVTTFDVTGPLTPPPMPPSLPDLEQKALASRPDFAAAQESVRVAEANQRLAVAGGTADPTLASEYERSGNDNTFGTSLQIPLRIFDRNQGEKERTRFETESARLSMAAARNQVISDVDQAWAALQTAEAQANRYNNRYLAEAARVRDNLEFSYRNGNGTLLDYLDALREFRAISLNALNSNAQVWQSFHQLSYATATEVLP